MSQTPEALVWFRRDLRLTDNPALFHAAESGAAVIPLYIFDESGEADWPDGLASRWWLRRSLGELQKSLRDLGSRLVIRHGKSEEILLDICRRRKVAEVYWNRRYEPEVVKRESHLKRALADAGVSARSFNASLLHSPLQIASGAGTPFKVFTPFWKRISKRTPRAALSIPKSFSTPARWPRSETIESLDLRATDEREKGFEQSWHPGEAAALRELYRFSEKGVERYAKDRDFPGVEGISRLSPRLRFGELSPSQIWNVLDSSKHEAYLRQIAWREFAYHTLYHFPNTPSNPLRPEFSRFPWKPDVESLEAWQNGRTGYPIVDAGMRALRSIGWMHNRVRMITASFLVKHLLISWQKGAEWFWENLVDADLANNTMGWQWVAGCGADAAPYFRIFNPMTQAKRFDPDGVFIRDWLPELRKLPTRYLFCPWEAPAEVLKNAGVTLGGNYPRPIVSHHEARQNALDAYRQMKQAGAADAVG